MKGLAEGGPPVRASLDPMGFRIGEGFCASGGVLAAAGTRTTLLCVLRKR